MKKSLLSGIFAAALIASAPSVSHAQTADGRVRGMIRDAIEEYQNLDVDGALNRLRLALNACGQRNCSPTMLARVHIAIGVVAVGGQNDTNTGIGEFQQALQLDSNAQPDAMLVTPEITAAFTQAQRRGGGNNGNNNGNNGGNNNGNNNGGWNNGGNNGNNNGNNGNNNGGWNNGGNNNGNNGNNNGNNGNNGNNNGGNNTPGPVTGPLLHTAVTEQLENTPVPIFVEPPTGMRPARVVIHYRGLGMTAYAELNATSVANGYGAEVPCGQVIAPHLDYYVTAHDSSGMVLGTAASEDSPNRVEIGRTRSRPAPSLPGRMPPETCGEDCPPGMTGPQCHRGGGSRGMRQIGDPCDTDTQCAEGLACHEGSCATDTSGGSSGGGSSAFYRFGFDLGAGVGLAILSPSNPTLPPEFDPGDGSTYADRYQRGVYYAEGRYAVACPRDFSSACIAQADDPAGFTALLTQGGVRVLGDSVVSTGADTLPRADGEPCLMGFRCPRLGGGGIAPTFFINAVLRVNVLKNLGFGVTVRFQPDFASAPSGSGASVGTLPMMVLGARAYYALTSAGWTRSGLTIAPFIGAGFGQIQPRPSLRDSVPAHVRSGGFNINVGGRVEYGFANMFHVGGDLALNLQIPVVARAAETFLVDIDIVANIGMHF